MKANRTSHKLPALSTENHNGKSKKLQKFMRKNLILYFSSVSEDSVDLSPISEISDANHNDDVIVSSNLNVSSDFNFIFDLVRVYVKVELFYSLHIDLCETKL